LFDLISEAHKLSNYDGLMSDVDDFYTKKGLIEYELCSLNRDSFDELKYKLIRQLVEIDSLSKSQEIQLFKHFIENL